MWGQPPATPVFEATSIKPSAPGRVGSGMNVLPARIRITNSSLKFCVQMAWNLQDYQVSGAQGWIETSKYDIEAVAASPFKPGEYRAMLQAMLTERFGLVIHRETKDKAGYALVIGRNGPKLPPPTEDPNILFQPDCFRRHDFEGHERIDEAVGGSSVVNSEGPVADNTGIEGSFDVSLQWTPDPSSQPLLTKSGAPAPPPPSDAAAGPSIFTALQEKLGLKLDARKVPIEIIVIDHANRPSEN